MDTKYFLTTFYLLITSIIFCFCLKLQAATSPTNQTQLKLKRLDLKINNLKHHLVSAHDKQQLLNKELSGTEKQISEGIHKLRSIQDNLTTKEQQITELKNTINRLDNQLLMQQQQLANHIRARYLMGNYQPVKWLLNQDDPYKVSRILTYYKYIINSRQQIIFQIDETRKKIILNKNNFYQQLAENRQLQKQLNQHQQQLHKNKKYHAKLIQSLNNQIQTTRYDLQNAQKDKDSLAHLLQSLARKSAMYSTKPFIQMRKKLPSPVHNAYQSLQKMNQGVTFFAAEGAIVQSVYSGKIVFSDWLKGYGLLLIIDHGQGFMTLYAHNKALFKHKGQLVRQKEQIASVGHSGSIKQSGLYFEIRLKGKAVSPFAWLAKV